VAGLFGRKCAPQEYPSIFIAGRSAGEIGQDPTRGVGPCPNVESTSDIDAQFNY